MNRRIPALLAGLSLLAGSLALAQTISIPQVTGINSGDLFQDVVNGAPQAQSVYAPAPLLGNYAASLPGNNPENSLIGGDFGLNLFQDGTTVSSITTTATYVADQWAAFSGTSTTLAGAKETAAADIPAGYAASLRITRSGAGVLQSCVAQEIASSDATRFQSQTAEIDLHALAGSGFSAASSNLTVVLVQGTGSDEGLTNLAHSINAALTGSNWTGVVVSSVNVGINTAWNRYSAVFPVASTTTELGVAFCWTPVGGSPSSDYFEFTGAQLVRNSALTTVAGTAGAALNPNDVRAKSYSRQSTSVEWGRQYFYYWKLNESATISVLAPCRAHSVTVQECYVKFPVAMRTAVTASYTAGFATETTAAGGTLGNCSALATATTVTSTAPDNQGVLVGCTATTVPAAGVAGFLFHNGGAGVIKASARF